MLSFASVLAHLQRLLVLRLARAERPLLLGLCGVQGSGKSTLAAALTAGLRAQGCSAQTLSIDDLYLGREARQQLAARVHPLLATRGVPGTHEVPLGLELLARWDAGRELALPRFDKLRDDRLPQSQWPRVEAPRLLILEGWCVAARPQAEHELIGPINALERDEDVEGSWRRWVNQRLAVDYPPLFSRIDCLLMLAAPDFGVVPRWRAEQERELAQRRHVGDPQPMSDVELARFIQHYERLSRHILQEMPARADWLLRLDASRQLLGPLP